MTLSYRKVNSESVKQKQTVGMKICAHFEFHATKAAEGEIYNT